MIHFSREIINNSSLKGDCLLLPLRYYSHEIKKTFSLFPKQADISYKVVEVFKRAILLLTLAIGASVLGLTALIGIITKSVHYAFRIRTVAFTALSAVTYTFSGGRFGDNLLSYLHAKAFAQKLNLPLIYKPFKGAEKFQFHEEELAKQLHLSERDFRVKVSIRSQEVLQAALTEATPSTLYELPFFPESPTERAEGYEAAECYNPPYFAVDWDDPQFKQEITRLLKSKEVIADLNLPKDKISVALHVRTGGTFDPPDTPSLFPAKLPPLTYYIGELKRLSEQLNKPLYVQIFTDDTKPEELRKKIEEAVNDPNITFAIRQDTTFMQDFCQMTQFDCLIRPDSNFSGVASKVANYMVEIFPQHYFISMGWSETIINQVTIKTGTQARVENVAYSRPFKMTRPVRNIAAYFWHVMRIGANFGRPE